MKLIFSEEADQDVEAIDAWWRENRLEAPRLFAEEVASVCQAIQRKPLIMKPYTERRGVVIRRWQLRRSLQHVYFFADVENDIVIDCASGVHAAAAVQSCRLFPFSCLGGGS